jgi:hypothetical protein
MRNGYLGGISCSCFGHTYGDFKAESGLLAKSGMAKLQTSM